jgi:hypothetical protein
MQRKNSILRASRNGIAMIMAIVAIVIISTIMALAISMTSQTTKSTTDVYLYEQSVLLAKSATEYALLKIAQENNSTNPCNVTSLNFKQENNLYDINVSILYVYTTMCPTASNSYTTVETEEQNGSILIDVAVSVTDTTVSTEPIRYFKRTIQKL